MNFISKTLCVFVFVWFTVLSKLVASLKEADSLTSEQELSFLQTLLQSKEINALVNVHSKVGKVCKDEKCAPLMSSSIQVRHIPSLPESHHIHESTLNTVYKFKCICCSVCIWKKKTGSIRGIGAIITALPHFTIVQGNLLFTTKTPFSGTFREVFPSIQTSISVFIFQSS